jgi:hypothetical protein
VYSQKVHAVVYRHANDHGCRHVERNVPVFLSDASLASCAREGTFKGVAAWTMTILLTRRQLVQVAFDGLRVRMIRPKAVQERVV